MISVMVVMRLVMKLLFGRLWLCNRMKMEMSSVSGNNR